MIEIRSFQNGDLPQLVGVFHEHHQAAGIVPRVTTAQFEQAVLARTSFRPDQLLMLVDNSKVLGWCHFFVVPQSSASVASAKTVGCIAASCFGTQCDTDSAVRLVGEAADQMAASGAGHLRAGLFHDEIFGYSGLEPYGPGFGVNQLDSRLIETLSSAGFHPELALTMLSANTDCYRAPVNREALQLRRTSSIEIETVIPVSLTRASAFSHLDILRHRLVDRHGAEMGQVDFWFSDAEAEVMSPSTLIVDVPVLNESGMMTSCDAYLIASVLGEVGRRGIGLAQVSVESSSAALIEQLKKMCFVSSGEGVQWERKS
ncbi:hypothetical protein N9N28_01190 [Rubripirellula amarantea]|nr:hypothetical protein [Rubripirellula amarantea]